MKNALYGGLAIVVLGLVVSLVHTIRENAKLEGARTEILRNWAEDSTAWRVLLDSMMRVDSTQAATIRKLKLDQDSIEQDLEIAHIEARTTAKKARLAQSRADSLRLGFEAIDRLEEEAETCALALRNCGSLTAELENRNANLVRANVEAVAQHERDTETISRLQAIRPKSSPLPWIITVSSIGLLVLSIIF